MSLIQELKRRNVFRAAIAYAIVAWLLMQIGDTLAPALHLPSWTTSLLAFFLILGFPLTIFFAWTYELTPEGIKTEQRATDNQKEFRYFTRGADFLLIGLLTAALGYFAYDKFDAGSPAASLPETAEADLQSIAVLPFANMSEDPNQEHFADGLTEELLNSLARLGKIRVISRTSSFAFKDRNVPVAEIAATLDVNHILEGSVRRAGNTVRVTAQLIDTSRDSHLWSDTYDHELNLDNILQIQEEIAIKVVNALDLQLLPQDSTLFNADGPSNLEALDLYHDGKFYLRNIETGQTEPGTAFEPAVRHFTAAIAADPEWAPPHAALGRTYHFWHSEIDDADKAETMRTSKEHVMDAIRLDKDYGPAYGSLGYILTMAGDYDGAMRALDRASELNINVSWENAILMVGLGRYDASIREYRNAVNHDPLSRYIRTQLAEAYMCSGRFADAIGTIEGDDLLVANGSMSAYTKSLLAESYIRSGNIEKGLQLSHGVAEETGDELPVALLFALAGENERARSILNLREIAGTRAYLEAARVLAVLGDEERTMAMLEQATASASNEAFPFVVLLFLQCSPEIRGLAGNPRYEALLDRLGLPD